MRDFTNGGDINGNVTINETDSNDYMPFDRMNVEQLQYNLKRHSKLEREERVKRESIANVLFGIALFFGVVLAIWYFISGSVNTAMFFLGMAGVGAPLFVAFADSEKKSSFEQRQIDTINYIATLIRERR